ncbi:MAG TPA: hypothetical protein VGI44_18520, partial [Acidimicrobiales bacterium]
MADDRPTIRYVEQPLAARETARQPHWPSARSPPGRPSAPPGFIRLEPWDWWLCVEEGERRQR